MKSRIFFKNIVPEAYKLLGSMDRYLTSIAIEPALFELIKIRASQINGCAYCIQIHANFARSSGESENRIYALSAWQESPLFDEKERVVLAMTEEITLIHKGGLSDNTYELAREHFDPTGIAHIILQIIAINSWNRMAVATQLRHE